MSSKFNISLKFIAAILLMIINSGIWINGLFINRERGMDIVLALPLLFSGTFLLLNWYRASRKTQIPKLQRWKFTLGTLMINYMILYLIYMISDIIFWPAIDLLHIPGVILPLLLALFITGFILSWRDELYAGILFILWYLLVLYGQFRYSEILHRGPYMLIGIAILIQGILYIYYHYRLKINISKTEFH